jgi:hypothetical protein
MNRMGYAYLSALPPSIRFFFLRKPRAQSNQESPAVLEVTFALRAGSSAHPCAEPALAHPCAEQAQGDTRLDFQRFRDGLIFRPRRTLCPELRNLFCAQRLAQRGHELVVAPLLRGLALHA